MSPASGVDIRTIVPDYRMSLLVGNDYIRTS